MFDHQISVLEDDLKQLRIRLKGHHSGEDENSEDAARNVMADNRGLKEAELLLKLGKRLVRDHGMEPSPKKYKFI
jgi:hypothetical protein